MATQRFLVPVLLLGLAACGGGGSGEGSSGELGSSSSSSGSERGGGKVKVGKGEVSVKAQAQYADALKAFRSFEPKNWNEANCDAAASKFESIASTGKFPEALYMAGLSHDRCGRTEKAKSFYDGALRADPKFCKARVAIGLAALSGGNEQAAEREFAQSVSDDPQCTEGYVNMAIQQRKRGLAGNKEALANLRRALAIDAQYLPAFNEMALL